MSKKQRRRANDIRKRAKKGLPPSPKVFRSRLHAPTFWEGIASLMDWRAKLVPTIRDVYGDAISSSEVDIRAIAEDWKLVGQDLYAVLWAREQRKTANSEAD